MHLSASDAESRDERVHEAAANVGFASSGQYDIRPVEKQDRMLVYLAGMLGGAGMIGGILAMLPLREQGS